MNGVTVVSEVLCRECEIFNLILGNILAIGIYGFIIWLLYKTSQICSGRDKKFMFAMIGLVICAFILTFSIGIDRYNNTYMVYEIMVDDSASFNDVVSTYEILDHYENEDIYWVKLKENTNE